MLFCVLQKLLQKLHIHFEVATKAKTAFGALCWFILRTGLAWIELFFAKGHATMKAKQHRIKVGLGAPTLALSINAFSMEFLHFTFVPKSQELPGQILRSIACFKAYEILQRCCIPLFIRAFVLMCSWIKVQKCEKNANFFVQRPHFWTKARIKKWYAASL